MNSNVTQVVATVPTRADLAGGTLDLWPLHCVLTEKATVNVGVDLPARAEVTRLEKGTFHLQSDDQGREVRGTFAEVTDSGDLPLLSLLLATYWQPHWGGLRLRTSAKSPAGAGLGGSSALAVAVAATLNRGRRVWGDGQQEQDEVALVHTVQNVEAKIIHAPTGCQDYWGAVRGAVNIVSFPFTGVAVQTFREGRWIDSLGERLLLCFSGQSRASAINNWEIFRRVFDRDQKLTAQLEEIGHIATECAAAVQLGDVPGILRASEAEWEARRALWPNIETDVTRALDRAARAAGAQFSRVCGAGGGGVMVVICPPDRRKPVSEALTAAGGTILDGALCRTGLRVKED